MGDKQYKRSEKKGRSDSRAPESICPTCLYSLTSIAEKDKLKQIVTTHTKKDGNTLFDTYRYNAS